MSKPNIYVEYKDGVITPHGLTYGDFTDEEIAEIQQPLPGTPKEQGALRYWIVSKIVQRKKQCP